jgi:hypothetical protein
MRRLLKLVHNPTVAILGGLAFALAVHLAFAFGAYGAGLAISENVLQSLPGVTFKVAPVMAFLYSILLFCASMWAFIYKNHTRKDIDMYDIANKKKGFLQKTRVKFEVLIWLVGAMELSSLMFRLSLMAPTVGRMWLAVFGIVLWLCAYLLGDVLHAVIHRPVERDLLVSQETAERDVIADSLKYLPKGTNEQRQAWRETGDPRILDEIKDSVEGNKRAMADQKITKQDEKAKEAEAPIKEFERLRGMKERFFGGERREPDPTPEPLELPAQSQNGHSNQPVNPH